MIVKYVRVSSQEQNTSRQEVNSQSFSNVYIDHISGSIPFRERKEGKKLIADIEAEKITEIHIMAIDRLGRSIVDILTMIEYFNT